ncbi:MazG nucleotide pyrophosphohydrolase domain-containing protein [Sediminibacillus albus]|uniref:MazG nucleotide pyrophosphohydrolase domain-containing protein n=1 Tax=Sediminibacillus albus TaxID=407036 RepID=A0A1G8WQT3_9BACI|nr:MazG nucleotide pyrophosphohydrolase domain-containing protein [Sediminibacillus albus]SDJ79985.1 MazG nucleotide pyrophosphohydrolase domain-containing protein [Sediminibacillus albus]
MKELQEYAATFQREMDWEISSASYTESRASLLNNYMLLTTEVAEIAEEYRKAFNRTNTLIEEGVDEQEAFGRAKESIKADISKEFADCLAYLTKMANYFEIDLEESFYAKMDEVKQRKNKDVPLIKKNK